MITIASWNVNSVRSRLDHLRRWLGGNNINILCLQETKVQDVDFPEQMFSEIGFQAVFTGQKSYNGFVYYSIIRQPILQRIAGVR